MVSGFEDLSTSFRGIVTIYDLLHPLLQGASGVYSILKHCDRRSGCKRVAGVRGVVF
jgi:hypothetical protein